MILPIVQVGDPVLRARAAAIEPTELPSLSGLITDMKETMHAAPGVGLAAPQIGRSLQLAVIEDTAEGLTDEQREARERRAVPFHVIVNPTIQPIGDEMILAYEGCLSFKGFVMIVPRARRVRVEALDEHGTPLVIEASGWYARILQHEIDHLHGVVCCDRMDPRTLSTVENREHFPGR
ncbi:MAG TPA: peptide deformylase [Kofleriaceae bacterium]|nr:peptide deformylase [Kofleriaceae bacterium]